MALVEKGQLGDIGFVEFTVNLISGVIDALISANSKQIRDFIELLEDSAKTLEEYTKNYAADHTPPGIGTIADGTALTSAQITAVAELVPDVKVSSSSGAVTDYQLLDNNGAPNTSALVTVGSTTTAGAFSGTGTSADPFKVAVGVGTPLDTALKAALAEAASNEHQLLQQMVKMGFSRIILDSGVIETRLTFNASTSSSNVSTTSSVQSQQVGVSGTASTRGKLAKFVALTVNASYSKVSVNMANQVHRDVTGSSVQIFGRVELHLKSDYMPLSK